MTNGCNTPVVSLSLTVSTIEGGEEFKYSCREALDEFGNVLFKYCEPDLQGQYSSLEECRIACPMYKYGCKELLDSKGNVLTKYCTVDPAGQYTSYYDCQKVCKK